MYRAGKGLFEAFDGWKSPVLIACGKGNNAGDGYVVAGLLLDRGIDVSLALVADKFSEDGRYYYDKVKDRVTETFIYEEGQDLSGYAVIVDCILGTGFSGEVVLMRLSRRCPATLKSFEFPVWERARISHR